MTNLCQCFNLEERQFIDRYCRWVPYYDGTEVLSLQERPNNDCILWDSGCTAYRFRPIQCSTYPFWTSILKGRETWEEEAKGCPGINRGKSHSCAEVEESLRRYEGNEPIRRQEG